MQAANGAILAARIHCLDDQKHTTLAVGMQTGLQLSDVGLNLGQLGQGSRLVGQPKAGVGRHFGQPDRTALRNTQVVNLHSVQIRGYTPRSRTGSDDSDFRSRSPVQAAPPR
jgi:hypothetical protein